MAETIPLLVYLLGDERYALRVAAVERIVRAVEVTPLREGPPAVMGFVNLAGAVVPVVNARRLFGLPERDIELTDRLIVVRTSMRPVALLVDHVMGVVERSPESLVAAEGLVPGLEHVHGVTRMEDALVLIQNLDEVLTPERAQRLERALAES